MKLLVCLLTVSFAGTAFADSVEVSTLNSVSYDGTMLSYSYRMGGGCQTHTPEVKLDLQVSNDNYL